MLKIAVVTRYFPSSAEPWQGRSAYETLRILSRVADIQVFYPNASYPAFLRPPSRIYESLDASYSPSGVEVTYHNYPALPFVSRPINGWIAARVLLPHIRRFGPDVVLGYFLYPEGYTALRIGQALGVPVIAKALGSDINDIGDWISARHTRAVLHQADLICAVCDDLRKKAVAMGATAERTRAVHNGCDLSVFSVRSRSEARRVLGIEQASQAIVYIGRMDVKKGLRELVDATVSLHGECPRLHTYLVGSGPDRAAIGQAILAAGASGFIHLPGACSPSDVSTWMTAADIVTLPSYMEGCPNVVLEALACGRPVVATRVGGIPELLDETCGVLVPARNSDALAQGLLSALHGTWDPRSISEKMSRSWEAASSELLSIIQMVAATSRARKTPSSQKARKPEGSI